MIRECAFCGGKLVLEEEDLPQFYFECRGCVVSINVVADSAEEAIKKVNCRAPANCPGCCHCIQATPEEKAAWEEKMVGKK